MRKFMKILLVAFIVLFVCSYIYIVNASSVNMNLPTDDYTTYGSSISDDNSTTNTPISNSSVVVSNGTENLLDNLTISDMINVVLCSIGIVIILLGFAIIIRQKSL